MDLAGCRDVGEEGRARRPHPFIRYACAALIAVVGLSALASCKGKPQASDENSAANGALRRFNYGSIVYQVPAAYAGQQVGQLGLTVTYPGFQPGGPRWSTCVDWFSADFVHKCAEFAFLVSGGVGPTREQRARNMAIAMAPTLHSVDDYGYTAWWRKRGSQTALRLGPKQNAYFTRGQGRSFIFFSCSMLTSAINRLDGLCTDTFKLSDGDSVTFTFPYHLRNELPGIEIGIDNLMRRFRTNAVGVNQ